MDIAYRPVALLTPVSSRGITRKVQHEYLFQDRNYAGPALVSRRIDVVIGCRDDGDSAATAFSITSSKADPFIQQTYTIHRGALSHRGGG